MAYTRELYSVQTLEARVLRSRCRQGHVPSRTPGAGLSPGRFPSGGVVAISDHPSVRTPGAGGSFPGRSPSGGVLAISDHPSARTPGAGLSFWRRAGDLRSSFACRGTTLIFTWCSLSVCVSKFSFKNRTLFTLVLGPALL